MKGMNAKLVLNDSTSYNQHILLDKLRTSCAEHDVPDAEKESVITAGLGLFTVEPSGVHTVPLGQYLNIGDFVKAHIAGTTEVDSDHLSKNNLYKRLLKAAEAMDMVEYRRLRKLYTAT